MILGRARSVVLTIGLPVALLAIWWFTSLHSTNFYFPPLKAIVQVFPATWFKGRLTADVLPSLLRLAAGYVAALVIGIALGTAIGSSRKLRDYLEPILEFLRAIPPTVLIPIFIVFAGIGDGMKVAVIVFGCVWPILLNTVEGVRGVDEVLRDTGRTYRLRKSTTLFKLTLRGASPQIMAGARQALSIAIILMVISELFASSNGLGFTTVQFQRGFAIPEMYTGIILLGIVGVLLAQLFKFAERHLLGWYLGIRTMQRKG